MTTPEQDTELLLRIKEKRDKKRMLETQIRGQKRRLIALEREISKLNLEKEQGKHEELTKEIVQTESVIDAIKFQIAELDGEGYKE